MHDPIFSKMGYYCRASRCFIWRDPRARIWPCKLLTDCLPYFSSSSYLTSVTTLPHSSWVSLSSSSKPTDRYSPAAAGRVSTVQRNTEEYPASRLKATASSTGLRPQTPASQIRAKEQPAKLRLFIREFNQGHRSSDPPSSFHDPDLLRGLSRLANSARGIAT